MRLELSGILVHQSGHFGGSAFGTEEHDSLEGGGPTPSNGTSTQLTDEKTCFNVRDALRPGFLPFGKTVVAKGVSLVSGGGGGGLSHAHSHQEGHVFL